MFYFYYNKACDKTTPFLTPNDNHYNAYYCYTKKKFKHSRF